MAGGIVLLSIMLLFFDPVAAIALHGVVQLVSNGTRTIIQREHIAWSLAWRYSILLLPMGLLGVQVAFALPPAIGKALIGIVVLIATWRPGWLRLPTEVQETEPRRRFIALGGVVGFIGPIIGATGPLIAPFFLNLGLIRQSLVGTKAACQALGHIAKIVVFGWAGFVFREHLVTLVGMSAMVVGGTWVGSRILERVNEASFVLLYRGVLTLVALRLVLWEGWRWFQPGL